MITYVLDPTRYYYKDGDVYSTMTHEPLKKHYCAGRRKTKHPVGTYVSLVSPTFKTPHRYYLCHKSKE